jgi:formylglycine-generating enzyme required for sulfatase activity/serine/threonine protein kinase
MSPSFQRDYLVRLFLPLAQLYGRAHNAKDARSRHDNTFYLFEALVKLAAAPLIAAYLSERDRGARRVEALDRLLAQLALPSLGQWVAMLRELARHFGERPEAAGHPLGHVWQQLRAPRHDLPAVLALYRRIKNGPDGQPAADQSCSLVALLESLVQYRNGVFGHGGPRFEPFYTQDLGPLLFPAANAVLAEGVFDLLGPPGSRLVYLTELRTVDEDRVEVGLRELVGLQGERITPLHLSRAQADGLLPNRVAVLWPGRPVPLRLDPLLLYREGETAEEVLFLNRDRNGRQVEYLSYTTGRTERDRDTAPVLAALLSRVVSRPVSEGELQALAERSRAETPSVEALCGPAPPAARLWGDYEILAEVGRGGMGVVYLARQLSLGRLVALKMLPADLADAETALARLRREIRSLARCDHPHIVKVLSSGTSADGQLYYAMEYVPGCDLEQVWRELAGFVAKGTEDGDKAGSAAGWGSTTWARAVLSASRKRQEQTAGPPDAPRLPLPPLPELPSVPDDPGGYCRRVATLVRDAARALQAVHDQNLVHRDVKPANLMLTPDGARVVLMDFGLAKGQSRTLSASRAGGFLGTLRYAAPEQLAASTLPVGPAADVRGLGVVLWELLTRRRLFADADDERQLAVRVHECDVPRLRAVDPGLDPDLEAVVARATERRTGDRIQSARELAQYLQLYLDGQPLPIRPPSPAEVMRRWVRDHKALVGSAGAAALAVVLTVVTAFVLITQSRDAAVGALSARALAQVDALLDANPQAVPNILQNLELARPEVVLRLRGCRDRKDLAENQRLRMALALLPADAAQEEYLRDRVWGVDLEEFLVLCDALFAYRPQTAAAFQAVLEDPGADRSRRFRAGLALARYDPGSPAGLWERHAEFLVGEWVADVTVNPSHYPALVTALRPVGHALLPKLGEVFHSGKLESERAFAMNILADLAGADPAALADLLEDADPRQYQVLLPKLAAHGAPAIALLRAELGKRPQPAWKDPPLDPSWVRPDPALLSVPGAGRVESDSGLLAERFALCQALPLPAFRAAAEGLRPAGYRPVRFRPYVSEAHSSSVEPASPVSEAHSSIEEPASPAGGAGFSRGERASLAGGQVRVAAVWVRDGRDWRLAWGSPSEVRRQDADLRAQGFLPVDAAGLLLSGGPPAGEAGRLCAALWSRPAAGDEDGRMCLDVPAEEHRAAWAKMKEEGFVPLTYQVTASADGRQRCSSVWRRQTEAPTEWEMLAGLTGGAYEAQVLARGLQVDVALDRAERPADGPGAYAAVWQRRKGLESAEVHGLDPVGHLARCRELLADGYRPAAIAAGGSDGPGAVVIASVWHRPVIPEEVRDALARRQANGAAALLALGHGDAVWPLFRHQPDPRGRSYLIHRLGPLQSDPGLLVRRLDEEKDVSSRRALLLSLGEHDERQLAAVNQSAVVEKLLRLYRDDPDPGIHSAAEWLVRKWDEEGSGQEIKRIDEELASARDRGERRWYVNGQGQTLAVVRGPVEFLMGSPESEAERHGEREVRHRQRIARSFALCTKKVTLEQFRRFRADLPGLKDFQTRSPAPDCPIIGVTWYDAAAYCRWLSEQEKVPEGQMCYRPIDPRTGRAERYPDYLKRTGYRLPTEAEWEYACRAGALTSRPYGETEELLGYYGLYLTSPEMKDRSREGTRPVGRLKPNDLGLFDMLGNACEWCQDSFLAYVPAPGGGAAEDVEEPAAVKADVDRVLRGGSFYCPPWNVRCAHRYPIPPSWHEMINGFRVARTNPDP